MEKLYWSIIWCLSTYGIYNGKIYVLCICHSVHSSSRSFILAIVSRCSWPCPSSTGIKDLRKASIIFLVPFCSFSKWKTIRADHSCLSSITLFLFFHVHFAVNVCLPFCPSQNSRYSKELKNGFKMSRIYNAFYRVPGLNEASKTIFH